ncbi:MAG: ketoacyl-ACP synthase III [Myxococcaceae bacterium]|nr:ketoacyl-ACP synthase III [Myxococcaceae bacterium]
MKIYRPKNVRLAALGRYVPDRVVTNAELASLGAAMSPDEMQQLSGITERRWAAPEQATSDLAAAACRAALQRASLGTADVDRLVLATVSPDHVSPSTACAVQKALELPPIPSFDVVAACSGFLFALDVAARAVETGDRAVLACAAEVRSRFLNLRDRSTCALFGDGAAAAVVAPGHGLLGIGLLSEGSGLKSVYVPAGGSREPATAETVAKQRHFIHMQDGPAVYFQAVEGMRSVAEELVGAFGMKLADVDLVVPHQANRRLVDRLGRLCGIPQEKVMVNIERLGNTAGASVALALEEALRTKRVKPGGKVLLVAAGAGYTAGAALLEVDEPLLAACS